MSIPRATHAHFCSFGDFEVFKRRSLGDGNHGGTERWAGTRQDNKAEPVIWDRFLFIQCRRWTRRLLRKPL